MPEGRRGINGHADRLHGCLELRIGTQGFDDGNGSLTVNGTGIMGQNLFLRERPVSILHADHVAPEAGAAGLHRDAAAGGLQRTSSRKILARITAENGQNGRITAGRHNLGHRQRMSKDGFRRHLIHKRLFRSLKRSSAAQLRHRIVCHSIANHKNVFHIPYHLSQIS